MSAAPTLPGIVDEHRDLKPANVLRRVEFWVTGEPRPMGSKSAFVIPGTNRAIVTDGSNSKPAAKKLKAWKASVCDAARLHCDGRPLDGCLRVTIAWYLERPSSHYGSGKNANLVRASAARAPNSKPDGDKLQRQVWDCLTQAGLIRDDCRITAWGGEKHYAALGQPTGARVVVEEMGQ